MGAIGACSMAFSAKLPLTMDDSNSFTMHIVIFLWLTFDHLLRNLEFANKAGREILGIQGEII
jgi:hypothetical protein